MNETLIKQILTKKLQMASGCSNLYAVITYKLAFAHLNISSIRNKFELLPEQVRGNVDILMVCKIKVDEVFRLEIF